MLGQGPEYRRLSLEREEKTMLGTVLIVILILALLGAMPRWPHSRQWGYVPSSGVGLVLVVVVILVLLGQI
jgi:Protein of unknown function (DUF3309)